MGYDVYNEERVVMESSSGPIKENIRHTVDDTVKQVHSSVASYLTVVKALAFEIHLVQATMTLSTVCLNNNYKSYTHEQIQSCEIPTCYKQRTKWLRTFDLMAKLMELLRTQNEVSNQLEAEQDDAVEISEDNTVRAMLQRGE
jgi:hypothetical protein